MSQKEEIEIDHFQVFFPLAAIPCEPVFRPSMNEKFICGFF